VTEDTGSWFGRRYARLSTGAKMLLILGLFLLPLGLIATLASVESARQKSAERSEETLARLEIKAQRINAVLSRAEITIGTASSAIAVAPPESDVCRTALRRLQESGMGGRFALFAGEARPHCATAGFAPSPPGALAPRPRTLAEIAPDGSSLRLWVYSPQGSVDGVAEFPREMLSEISYIPGTTRNFDLDLTQNGRRMVLRNEFEAGPFLQTVSGSEPIAGGQLQLSIALSAVPISGAEILMILLPVLMWLAAAVIGYMVADRLLLRPLVGMQRAVAAYRPGDRNLDIPRLRTPAREIGALAEAFDEVAQTVARHEAELEAAVERQRKLVREVHHRVKNNLQVVASLLNLHARGAKSEDVGAAYASIQRRVDALAVVHRNHYAELEENRGVALKPLISELCANLRATAPTSASHMVIRLDLEPYYATQDVAVSVAFLITEMVEFAMFCGANSVEVALAATPGAATATLAVRSESLCADVPCDPDLATRFDRIVTGLSRQLRSEMRRDGDEGRYEVDITVVDKAESRQEP
jgi:two-component sensor histidine kinase